MTTEATAEIIDPVQEPEVVKNPVTELDPEGDGLDKGQVSADVHGDVLGL